MGVYSNKKEDNSGVSLSGLVVLSFIIMLIVMNAFIYEVFEDFTLVRLLRNSAGGIIFIFGLIKLLDFAGFVEIFQNCFGKNGLNKVLGNLLPFVELLLGMLFIINFLPKYFVFVVLGFAVFSLFLSLVGYLGKSGTKDEKCMNSFVKLPLSLVNLIGYGLVLIISCWVLAVSL